MAPRFRAWSRPASPACSSSMTASAVRSSSRGLNHKISAPGSFFTGTWPGGMSKCRGSGTSPARLPRTPPSAAHGGVNVFRT
jgi:hypothetical protein